MVRYTIRKNNLHIFDSYQVSKKNFAEELENIKSEHPESEIWNRKINSLRREWATHNFCYALHIYRSRTADVDLNYPQKWYEKIGYSIFGAIALIFIK